MTLTKQRKRDLKGLSLSLIVALIMSLLFWQESFRELEWLADDVKTQLLRADTKANEDIVVLLVDEAALSSMEDLVGRWPWPRSIWADVLEYLAMGGAQSVGFDILFTESSAGNLQGGFSEHDQALIDMSEQSQLATHSMQLLEDSSNPYADRPLPPIFTERFAMPAVEGMTPRQNDTFYIPFEGLYQAAQHMAVVEFSPDSDGDYRRTRLFREYQGHYYPVLSMAILRNRYSMEQVQQNNELNQLRLDDLVVPLDREHNYQVNFYQHFESYSLSSVLASIAKLRQGDLESLYQDPNLVPPDAFENKIILIGSSAVGLKDLKSTPMNARWPGVFLHASIASNIIEQDFIYPVSVVWTYATIFLLAILTGLVILAHGALTLQILYPALLALIYSGFNIGLQSIYAWQIAWVAPVLTVFFTWLIISAYLSATEGREKKRVRAMLAQYVSPAALHTVLDNYEDQIQAEIGKEEEMSVVFSDVRSFTTISEGLKPAEVVKLLNIHLDAMTQVTFDHGGTMDKFIGDATMAFWGAPLPDAQHALHATQAAIAMSRAMEQVNAELAEHGINPIAIGVGVNTGRVILGNIGSSQKLDYTVIGDAVNLGSRLEGLTKQYGVKVLISEFTQEVVAQHIPCALVDMVRVKGKNKPVKIYAPLGVPGDSDRADQLHWVGLCQLGFDFYHQQKFTQAQAVFAKLPENPFAMLKQIYQLRCEAYLVNPPDQGWDGVYTLTTK